MISCNGTVTWATFLMSVRKCSPRCWRFAKTRVVSRPGIGGSCYHPWCKSMHWTIESHSESRGGCSNCRNHTPINYCAGKGYPLLVMAWSWNTEIGTANPKQFTYSPGIAIGNVGDALLSLQQSWQQYRIQTLGSCQRSWQEAPTGEWTLGSSFLRTSYSFQPTFHCCSDLAKPSQVTASLPSTCTGLEEGNHLPALVAGVMSLHLRLRGVWSLRSCQPLPWPFNAPNSKHRVLSQTHSSLIVAG